MLPVVEWSPQSASWNSSVHTYYIYISYCVVWSMYIMYSNIFCARKLLCFFLSIGQIPCLQMEVRTVTMCYHYSCWITGKGAKLLAHSLLVHLNWKWKSRRNIFWKFPCLIGKAHFYIYIYYMFTNLCLWAMASITILNNSLTNRLKNPLGTTPKSCGVARFSTLYNGYKWDKATYPTLPLFHLHITLLVLCMYPNSILSEKKSHKLVTNKYD